MGGTQYTLFIHPKQDIRLDHLELQFQLPSTPPERFYADGFQSRSACKQVPAGKGYASEAGNSGLKPKPSHHCGWTHAWARAPQHGWKFEGNTVQFLFWGTLSNNSAYTYFQFEPENNLLRVRQDLGGLELSHSFPAMDLWTGTGSSEQEVYGRWFEALGKSKIAREPVLVWTSFGKKQAFGQNDLTQLLENLSTSQLPFQWVFLADGWQKRTGDWLNASSTFPGGLGLAAQSMNKAGYKAGIELAPFVASPDSDIVRQWPDGLLKDTKGNNLRTPEGHFILNFYHGGVQDHLNGVLHVIAEKWGFDAVHFTQLDVVAFVPPNGKTRGQVMGEALQFLRRASGNMLLMADNVPLSSAIHGVDVVRVCPEPMVPPITGLAKYFPWQKKTDVFAGLKTALARWSLHGNLWKSETGNFSLLDTRFLPVQQSTALLLQALLGGILRTNDDPSVYSAEQLCELEEALQWQKADVLSVAESQDGVFTLELVLDGDRYTAFANLTHKAVQPKQDVALMPWESIVLLRAS